MKSHRPRKSCSIPRRRRRFLLTLACLTASITAAGAVDDFSWPAAEPELVTGSLGPARLTGPAAEGPSERDIETLGRALGHYERGRIAEGDAEAGGLERPIARLAAEWAAVRSGSPAIRLGRILAFLDANPDWAAPQPLRRRAEEAMLAQRAQPATVLGLFARWEPTTPAGRLAQALALDAEGRGAEALALARALWRDEALTRDLEERTLKQFGERFTARDHRNRMEQALFRGANEAALRAAARAGADHVRLAQARIALNRKSSGAKAALDAVPASLHRDSSFIFARAQHLRRADDPQGAARLLKGLTRDAAELVDGDEWWVERRLIARQLLDRGEHGAAYEVAAGHAAEKPTARIEAEWHAGWIALRFLERPALALTHFDAAAALAETPISIARAAYWQGRALEAAGDIEGAERRYARAAEQHVAFYGQVARARLGLKSMPLRKADGNAGADLPAVRALELMAMAGEHAHARTLALDLARALDDPATMERVARTARRIGEARFLVSLGKLALHRGLPLDLTAFPTSGMPDFALPSLRVERAMVFAIARQESAFDPAAKSHAGARGLMQMMLPTARETARRFSLPFEPNRLTGDAAYNARLGAAHLADLLREYRGSYVLAFAAYNAGGGNVRDWIEAYGDPRQPHVDPIDWIERIPFTETRHYVQRVMENLQVYRALVADEPGLLMASDLRRGLRAPSFPGEGAVELASAP